MDFRNNTQESGQPSQQLKCKNCNGVMEIDFDKGIATCPYCGSIETITESDSVKLERMRTKAETERRAYEKEESERQERQNAIKAFKERILSKVILVFAFMALLLAVSNFSRVPLSSILMLVSGALLGFSWIVGSGLAKNTKQHSYVIFAIAGFVLLIVAFALG